MRIDVTVLGTAGSSPTKTRHLPSVALVYNGDVFLFDCGEGTQMQMLQYGINLFKTKAIFISHVHGDHLIGIAGLVRTLAMGNRKEPLFIFVPKGYERAIKPLIDFDKAMIGYQINVFGISSGTIYKEKGITVSAFKLLHTIPTYGYVFKEDDKLRFNKEKAKALGIKGEMFAQLQKRGSIKVKGKTITLKSITWKQEGKRVVYATDTRPARTTITAAKNADLLIHESAYLDRESKLAKERGHSTAAEVAALAKRAKVKRLVLTHISARYKTEHETLNEARKIFKNVDVARDGYTVTI